MDNLNLKRLALLLKKDFIENISPVLKLIAVYLFVVFIITIIQLINDRGFDRGLPQTLELFYYAGLIILGVIVAGFSFPALRKKEKAVFYLTLPVSTLERFLSFLILSLPGFFILYTILYLIFSLALYSVYDVFFDLKPNKYHIEFFKMLGLYVRLNALFLLGAVYFRRTPPFFTVVYTGIVILFLALFISIIAQIFHIINIPVDYILGLKTPYEVNGGTINPVWQFKVLRFLYLYGLVLFFWFVSVIRLKEKQV